VVAARQSRSNWLEARGREAALMRMRLPVVAAPQVLIPPPPPPVQASTYLDIAAKELMSRDRNPTVIIEPPPPLKMPPFPRFYGVMDFGEGPSIILAESAGGGQRQYRLGDKVGEFKLASIDPVGLTFEWHDKQVFANYSELRDKTPQGQSSTSQASASAASGAAASTPVTTVTQISPSQIGKPGADVGAGTKACVPGDSSPAGSVSDGFRKVVVQTPFGNACRWEPVH
jgi:hypothetical protein